MDELIREFKALRTENESLSAKVDKMEQDYSPTSEITHALEEDVFENWDEAENAFIGFDKDSAEPKDVDWTNTETEAEKNFGKDYFYDKEGR